MNTTTNNIMPYHQVILLGVILILTFNDSFKVHSFIPTCTPLKCSLREPKQSQSQQQFSLPQIPTFFNFNSNTNNPNFSRSSGSSSNKNRRTINQPISNTAIPVQLQQQEETESKFLEETKSLTSHTNSTNGISNGAATTTTEAANKKPNDEKIETLETRSAIMEHALTVKNGELETLNRRNILLQDVVKKLQLSNRNLLDKVHQLQHEKEGMHIETDSQELWPPEMEMQVLREEYNSKEMEWQNALDNSHVKFMRLRDRYYEIILQAEELQKQVTESEEKITYYEEKSEIDENDICMLKEQIELKDRELGNNVLVDVEEDEEVDEEVEDEIVDEDVEIDEDVVDEDEEVDEDILVEDEETNGSDEVTLRLETKVEELELAVAELEKENEDAKTFLQDMREKAEEKRQAIQKIVEEEQEKKKKIEAELKSSQAQKSDLEKELDTSKTEIENLKLEIERSVEEAEIRQKEEEERAKTFSKESLDIATAAVRQAEERELDLKQELKRTNKKMDRVKSENEELYEKLDELEKSIEEDMEKYNQNMELLRLENDWKLEINELGDQLQDARENRDIFFQEGLRLREALNEKTKRYMMRMETSQASWDELLLTEKNEHSAVVKDLNEEIATLRSTIDAQKAEIQNLSKNSETPKPELLQEAKQVGVSNATVVETSSVPNETKKPKRFKRIRAQITKVRQWIGKKLRRT